MAQQQLEDGKKGKTLTLFGGEAGWCSEDWTASDDRVRGGKSQSYLECGDEAARFYGNLDIKTLGGAGFASQRTTGEDREWDLSDYAGIQLEIGKGDKKRYTLILKDTLLPPKEETAREQATISWECDFELPPQTKPGEARDKNVFIPWKSLNPTYRGKVKKDADPIDLTKIKRISIMMRSFFGSQEGDFSLTINNITALSKVPPSNDLVDLGSTKGLDSRQLEAGGGGGEHDHAQSPFYTYRYNVGIAQGNLEMQKSSVHTLAALVGLALIYYYWRR